MTIERAHLEGSAEARTLLVDVHETQVISHRIGLPFYEQLVVRNGPRREAMFTDPRPLGRTLRFAEPIPYNLLVWRGLLQTRTSFATDIDQAWIDQAELVRLEAVPLGGFTLTLQIDDFVMKAPTR